jgi:hypothetical protein
MGGWGKEQAACAENNKGVHIQGNLLRFGDLIVDDFSLSILKIARNRTQVWSA